MKPATPTRGLRLLVPIAVIVVAALLIVLVVWMQRDSAPGATATPEETTGTSEQQPPADAEASADELPDFSWAERRDTNDPLAAGPVDAPLGLIVFSDYQCPFCAQWNKETLPTMMDLAEEGKLRIEWRDTNIFGPASERASLAAYAAAMQGKFWQYHDLLFEGGEKRSESQLSDDALIALAAEVSLDTDQFAADMKSEKTALAVAENVDLAMQLGAMSTPTFLFGGVPISGAHPVESFLNIYEALLIERVDG